MGSDQQSHSCTHAEHFVLHDIHCDALVIVTPAVKLFVSCSSYADRRLVAVPQQQGGPEIQWEGESRWIAVSSALLGEVGRMQVLTPTILVHPASDPPSDLAQTSDAAHTSGVTSPGPAEAIAMTPPPPEFLPPDIIAAAKQWMTMAADRLAIAGAAHMDAFVHADKGEIIIIDVHSVPDLSQDSLLLQQVSLGTPTDTLSCLIHRHLMLFAAASAGLPLSQWQTSPCARLHKGVHIVCQPTLWVWARVQSTDTVPSTSCAFKLLQYHSPSDITDTYCIAGTG